jgi:hypothetical protein
MKPCENGSREPHAGAEHAPSRGDAEWSLYRDHDTVGLRCLDAIAYPPDAGKRQPDLWVGWTRHGAELPRLDEADHVPHSAQGAVAVDVGIG